MDKYCSNCAWDDMCDWRFQDERGYCDKWKPEAESGYNERRLDSAELRKESKT